VTEHRLFRLSLSVTITWGLWLALVVRPMSSSEAAAARAIPARVDICGQRAMPNTIPQTIGFPPRKAWVLPNDRGMDWNPFALDGSRVLMIRGEVDTAPVTGMAIVRLGSKVLEPVPPSAYPLSARVGRWYLDWPWVVGEKWTNPSGPSDWALWAGNVVTGKHVILDHAVDPRRTGLAKAFWGMSVGEDQVAWSSVLLDSSGTVVRTWVNVYNLVTGRHRQLATRSDGSAYSDVTEAGSNLVAVRFKGTDIDLFLISQVNLSITNLTHNWRRKGLSSGVSMEPSLSGNFLAFKQAPSPYSSGDIVLWRLGQTKYPIWRMPGRSWLLDSLGEGPLFGDGIVAWQARYQATVGIFDCSFGRTWILQDPRKIGNYVWQLDTVNGRDILLSRNATRSNNLTYVVWRIPQ
jgi:hypothetical protein